MKQSIFAILLLLILIGCTQHHYPDPVKRIEAEWAAVAPPENPKPVPKNYARIVEAQTRLSLKDPDSGKFVFSPNAPQPCGTWKASGQCGVVMVNAKNSYGGYTGFRPFLYILDGDTVILFEKFEEVRTKPSPIQ